MPTPQKSIKIHPSLVEKGKDVLLKPILITKTCSTNVIETWYDTQVRFHLCGGREVMTDKGDEYIYSYT